MVTISGRETLLEIAADHAEHPLKMSKWKQQDGESTTFRPRGPELLVNH